MKAQLSKLLARGIEDLHRVGFTQKRRDAGALTCIPDRLLIWVGDNHFS